MPKMVTVAEMRAIEKEADSTGITFEMMMKNAGEKISETVQEFFETGLIIGLVGSGNNGGDTLVALASLAHAGWQAKAYIMRARSKEDNLIRRLIDSGGEVFSAEQDKSFEKLDEWLKDATVLLDGVLGTGTRLPLLSEIGVVLKHIKNLENIPPVIAIDCPSGVDCDTGLCADETIPADITICMASVKRGLLKFPAFNLIGRLEIVDIGLPEDLPELKKIKTSIISSADVEKSIPARPNDAHKGTFGTAMIAAGSVNYTGAAWLAGMAAYRIGAGLVKMAVPGPLHTTLSGHFPEAVWLLLPHEMGVISENAVDLVFKGLENANALLIGPGWGIEDTTATFLRKFLSRNSSHSPKTGIGFLVTNKQGGKIEPEKIPPLVIDADGLKLLSSIPEWHKLLPTPTILTPHPGEMAALTGLSIKDIQNDRIDIAKEFANKWGQIIVLKGAITVIADSDERVGIIPVATAALARAGTGDVLAGLITGLLAQGVSPFEAATASAWIHARAGLLAEDTVGHAASVLASDVLFAIPEVLRILDF